VLVNQGKPATDRMVIKPGDRVMAPAGARVEISYDDGCRLTIQSGAVVTVPQLRKGSVCSSGKAGGCSERDDPDPCRIEREGEHDDWLLIVGGAVAVGMAPFSCWKATTAQARNSSFR
jgi:hypothetical protein